MHISIKYNDLDIIKYLLNKKLPVNIKNKFGDTPLHTAMRVNDHEVSSYYINSYIR